MKIISYLHRCMLLCLLCFQLVGCSDDGSSRLRKEDIYFAAFYTDYLLLSGVEPADKGEELVVLSPATVDQLLANHHLTRQSMAQLVATYRRHPEQWQLVLEQVRGNLRNKAREAHGQ